MTYEEQVFAAVQKAFDAGKSVTIATALKAWKFQPKHRDMLRLKNGKIQMQRGKSWDIVAFGTLDYLARQVGVQRPNESVGAINRETSGDRTYRASYDGETKTLYAGSYIQARNLAHAHFRPPAGKEDAVVVTLVEGEEMGPFESKVESLLTESEGPVPATAPTEDEAFAARGEFYYRRPNGDRIKMVMDGGGLLEVGKRRFDFRMHTGDNGVQSVATVIETIRNGKVVYLPQNIGRAFNKFNMAMAASFLKRYGEKF